MIFGWPWETFSECSSGIVSSRRNGAPGSARGASSRAPDRIEVGIYAAKTMEENAQRVFHYLPKTAEGMRKAVDTTFSIIK